MARSVAMKDAEETPEADRLEGVPHPRHTRTLFGHAEAAQDFRAAVEGGRPHHGWLLTGPEGIGKATLAWGMIRFLLAQPEQRTGNARGADALAVVETAPAFRQTKALSHPGLLLLRRPYDAKTKKHMTVISVDEVRRLKGFLAHTAGDGGFRAVLVDAADDMNVNSANALLKSLEEPPARTMFFLVSSEPGRLLPTIRSRCRTLPLAALEDANLKRAMEQALSAGSPDGKAKPVPSGDWPQLAELSRGSVRRAITAARGDGLKLYKQLQALFATLPKLDWATAHALADELAPAAADEKFQAFTEMLLDLMHRLTRARALGQGADAVLAARAVPPHKIRAWAEAYEAISEQRTVTLAVNLDRRAFLIETFARLQAISAP